MIERETQIYNDLRASLHTDDKITQEKIVKSSLSEFTKNYIFSMVEDVNDHEQVIDRISKANKLRFNYAIRPKWTLLTYMFGNYESRPPSDIAKKLEVFPFYNFYIDSINDLLKDNFSIFITRNEISLLIDETNKAIYRKLTSDINNAKIKNFFLQIYQLSYGEHELNLESTIPYSFIKIFLNDKYYFDLEKKFQLVKGINDEYEISLKDVIKVLMNKYVSYEPGETIAAREVRPPVAEPQTAVEESRTRPEKVTEPTAAKEINPLPVREENPPKIEPPEPEPVRETRPEAIEITKTENSDEALRNETEEISPAAAKVISKEKTRSEDEKMRDVRKPIQIHAQEKTSSTAVRSPVITLP
jgi:hypothetical protein